MVAEVVYGSMMLDEWDHRIIRTYAKGYFQPNLVETGVCLLPDLLLPVGQTTDKYLEFIEKLPMRDHLKHCGLSDAVSMPIHADHLRSFCQVLESHAGLHVVRVSTANDSLGTILDEATQLVANMNACVSDSNGRSLVVPSTAVSALARLDAVQNVVQHEAARLHQVISVVKASLERLINAHEVESGWTFDIVDLTDKISKRQVPPQWTEISWSGESLSIWWSHLMQSVEQMLPWSNGVQPRAVWLGGLFYPSMFLHAVCEETTLKLAKWPLSEAVLYSEVKNVEYDELTESAEIGAYVRGLVLEGASWSRRDMRLTECLPTKIHDSLPVVWFYAVNQADTLTDVPYLRVPLYRTRDRAAHFIDAMYLKTCGDLAKWTLRGTAVLATVDGCSL